jgi:transformer-2 protein
MFTKLIELEQVSLITDRRTGESKCYAFVNCVTTEDAAKAKEALNGTELHGKKLRIDFSFTKRAHSPTPGRYMGPTSRSSSSNRYHPYDSHYRRSPPRDYLVRLRPLPR